MRSTSAVLLAVLVASTVAPTLAHAQGQAASGQAAPGQAAQTKPSSTDAPKSQPSPEKMEEARQRFQRGLQLFEEKNYEAARVELERAYRLAPTWKLLYNIGICYSQRGDYVEALKDLERYLREGGDQVSAERRDEVNKEIANLKPRIASVRVKTNVDDADLAVDDQPVGKVTEEAIIVNPGKRKLSISKAGYFAGVQVVEAAGSDKLDVTIDLKPLPKATKTDIAPIIAWSVTGALAVGAGITGYLTTRADKNLDDERNNPRATAASLDDAASQLKVGALVTDILIAGTIVGVGASVYLTWFRGGSEKSASASVGVSPTGLRVLGTF